MRFRTLNDKRAAIRQATEPRGTMFGRMVRRVRGTIEAIVYRIRRPWAVKPGTTVHTGSTVREAMMSAAQADLDAIEIPFGQWPSRAWMRDGNAANSVVPGSYEDEISRPTLYVATGRRRQ